MHRCGNCSKGNHSCYRGERAELIVSELPVSWLMRPRRTGNPFSWTGWQATNSLCNVIADIVAIIGVIETSELDESDPAGLWITSYNHSSEGRVPIYQLHTCKYRYCAGALGHRVLSCEISSGHIPHLAALIDVMKCTLQRVGLPSIMEPIGLDIGDGKFSDGMIFFPMLKAEAWYRHNLCRHIWP